MNRRTQLLGRLALVLALLLSGNRVELLASAPTPIQSAPQVTTQLSTGVATVKSEVICMVQVDGARQATLTDVPAVDGVPMLKVSGPSRQDINSFRTGRKITHVWAVTFRPDREGEFILPPMTLNLDGKLVQTRELTLSVVKDLTGQELGHLEFEGLPEYVFEGQPFTVRMNFGWDSQFDARVNVANLILPWWNELPGTLEVESAAAPVNAPLVEVQVNSRTRVRALDVGEQEVRGKPFRMLQLSRSFVATRSGKLEFPTSWLEFGHVRRRAFSEDRETYHVGAPAFSMDVKVLPEAGRPPEYSGGVGRFEAQGDVNRRDIDLGESIKLTVDWTGDANLEFFDLPNPGRLTAFEDFRVYGMTNERFYGDRRRVVYDLAPKNANVGEVPALPLVVFDPELKTYRTVSTRPIPIRVRAPEGATELTVEGADEGPPLVARDIQEASDVAPDVTGVSDALLCGTWIGLPLLWLFGRSAVRRRGDPNAPEARRRRKARTHLNKDLRKAKSAAEQARALQEFLGARSAESFAAWEGRDLATWLSSQERELPEATVREATEISRALDASRWAGEDQPLDGERLRMVADELMKGGL